MKFLLIQLFFLGVQLTIVQGQTASLDCFDRFSEKGKSALAKKQFDDARSQFNAALECPGLTPEQRASINRWFKEINEEINRDERANTQKAIKVAKDALENARLLQEAKAQTDRAKAQSDSLLVLSKINEKRATGNELGFKALVELREGDRTAALRLAEFTEKYTDPGNAKALEAVLAAAYHNNDPRNTEKLAWRMHGFSENVGVSNAKIIFSNDGERLGAITTQGTARVWEVHSGRLIFTLQLATSYFPPEFSGDLAAIAVIEDKQLRVLEIPSQKEIFTTASTNEGFSAVRFSPDRRKLIVTSEQNGVEIFDLKSKQRVFQLPEDNLCYGLHFSQYYQCLAKLSQNRKAEIYDLQTGQLLILNETQKIILSAAFSPDAKYFACATDQREILLFQSQSGVLVGRHFIQNSRARGAAQRENLVQNQGAPYKLQFSADGSHLTAFYADRSTIVFTVSDASGLFLQNIFTANFSGIFSAECNADASKVVFNSGDRVEILDLSDKNAPPGTPPTQVFFTKFEGKYQPPYLFSPSGKRWAWGRSEGKVSVFDFQRNIYTHLVLSNSEPAKELVFSPDERFLAVGREQGAIEIWDAIGTEIPYSPTPLSGNLLQMVFSPEGKKMALLDDAGKLTMVRTDDDEVLFSRKTAQPTYFNIQPEEKPLLSIPVNQLRFQFSADSRQVALFGRSLNALQRDTIHILDAADGSENFTLFAAGFKTASFCGGGRFFKIVNNFSQLLFEAKNGKPALFVPADSTINIQVSEDGNWVAYKTAEAIFVRNTQSGKWVLRLDSKDLEQQYVQKNISDFNSFKPLEFSPDNQKLLIQTDFGRARIYNTNNWQILGQISFNGNQSLHFSPDSRRITTISYSYLSIWDASDGSFLTGQPTNGDEAIISKNGQWLATAQQNQVLVFDFLPMQQRMVLRGHRGRIGRIAFSEDGKMLATASEDRSIKVWNLQTAREIFTISGGSGTVAYLQFSPDGRRLTANYEDGKICSWIISSKNLFDFITKTSKIAALNEDQIYRYNLEQAFLTQQPEAALENMEPTIQLGFARYFVSQAGISLDPKHYQPLYSRAALYFRAAVSNLDSEIAFVEMAQLHLNWAEKLRKDSLYNSSRAIAQIALNLLETRTINHPDLLENKGYAAALVGKRESAYNYFAAAIELDFSKINTIRTKVDFLAEKGDDTEKWSNFSLDKIIEGRNFNLNGVGAELNTAPMNAFEIGDYESAATYANIEMLRTLFDLHSHPRPTAATATAEQMGNLAWFTLFTKGGAKHAEQYAEAALVLDSTVTFVNVNLGHAALLAGDFDRAIQIYDRLKNEWWTAGNTTFEEVILSDLEKITAIGKPFWNRNVPRAAQLILGERWDSFQEKRFQAQEKKESPQTIKTQTSKIKKEKRKGD